MRMVHGFNESIKMFQVQTREKYEIMYEYYTRSRGLDIDQWSSGSECLDFLHFLGLSIKLADTLPSFAEIPWETMGVFSLLITLAGEHICTLKELDRTKSPYKSMDIKPHQF